MRAIVKTRLLEGGEARVPGDKSIAHRWLILAATAGGRSVLRGVPPSLDVLSTARVMAALSDSARPGLETWLAESAVEGSVRVDLHNLGKSEVIIDGHGRVGLSAAPGSLDCGNSGTTMRLVTGVVAAGPFRTVLTGDSSLLRRPMERVAEPLRAMGAEVRTTAGRPPIEVQGGSLRGIRWAPEVPSAQVKTSILLAGLAAHGETTVIEETATRDHTERALEALGAPVRRDGTAVTVAAFQHGGLSASVPGDVSSAAFLAAAAAVSGSEVEVRSVGLNPTRTRFLDVLGRMGARSDPRVTGQELGEPVGDLPVTRDKTLRGTTVRAEELPLVIDEVPALAVVAAFAEDESRFEGGGELRLKESDRLTGLAEGIRGLGGQAAVQGDALVVAGGGLAGGSADAGGDHRLAMALVVGAVAAEGSCVIDGVEWADVSFPGFLETLRGLGASIEVSG